MAGLSAFFFAAKVKPKANMENENMENENSQWQCWYWDRWINCNAYEAAYRLTHPTLKGSIRLI